MSADAEEDRAAYRKALEQRLHQAVAALDAVRECSSRSSPSAPLTYSVLHFNMFVESAPGETVAYLEKEIGEIRSMLKEV